VALYYYTTKQYGLAKNYMGIFFFKCGKLARKLSRKNIGFFPPLKTKFLAKATSINSRFGEAWLAFGHILAASCDSEQAQNCYLRVILNIFPQKPFVGT